MPSISCRCVASRENAPAPPSDRRPARGPRLDLVLPCVAAALWFSTVSLGARSIPFAGAAFPVSVTDPTSVEAADINGDGEPDLVVTGAGGTLDWLEWTGSGYTAHQLSSTLSAPTDVAVDDFDCDGRLDIAVADQGAGTIELYVQGWIVGSLGIVWPTPNTSATGVARIASADMDRDGTPDIILVRPASDTVEVMRGTDCNWVDWPVVTVTSSAGGVSDVAASDMDGDGFIDLVLAATDDDEVLLSLSNGDGTFTTSTLGALIGVHRVAVGDFDQNGTIDVAAASSTTTRWFANDGSWTANDLDDPQALGAASLLVGDMEGDGDLDLAVIQSATTRGADGTLGWWENQNGWTYRAVDAALPGPNDAALLDRGRDRDLDVALADDADDLASTFENRTFARRAHFPAEHFLPMPYPFFDLVDLDVGDVDGDGDLDLIATDRDIVGAYGYVWWLENGQDGTTDFLQIGSPQSLAFQDLATFEGSVVGDFDRDGKLDAVVGADFNVAISASFCPQPASLATWWVCDSMSSGDYHTIEPDDVGDIDGDGDLDIVGDAVAAITDTVDVFWWESEYNAVTDSVDWILHVIDPMTTGRKDLAVGDLDGDGDLDIVASNEAWWRNDGGDPIVWDEQTIPNLSSKPALGDIDLDGDLDIVALHIDLLEGPVLAWFENTSAATVWSHHVIWQAADASGPAGLQKLADVDGDGDLDVISGSVGETSVIAWYENDRDDPGSPWPEHRLPFGEFTPTQLAIADFDLDGDADVVAEPGATSALDGWTNGAGQFAVDPASASGEPIPDTEVAVLELTISHLGRVSDLDLEWRGCTLRFESAPGIPLTQVEFDEFVVGVELLLDQGDGAFDGGESSVGSWSSVVLDEAGDAALDLSPADPDTTLTSTDTRLYFVALALSVGADLASLSSFDVVFDPLTCRAVDVQEKLALSPQWRGTARVTLEPAHPIFTDGFETGDTTAWI